MLQNQKESQQKEKIKLNKDDKAIEKEDNKFNDNSNNLENKKVKKIEEIGMGIIK